MAATVQRKCQNCKTEFPARVADVKRGWAKFCSKSCKATRQEARTGQHRTYLARRDDDGDEPTFSNAHLFSNEE